MAAICRHTVWTHPPEPDDLQNEGLWCLPLCERRPNVRFCGHQNRSQRMGSSHGFDNGTAPRKMTILNGAPICGVQMRPMASSPRIVRICASVCPYTHRRVARRGRIVSPAAVPVANKILWICRCAWTTLTRRPQLHRGRPTSVSYSYRLGKEQARAGAETPYEAAASSVTQSNARLTPIALM